MRNDNVLKAHRYRLYPRKSQVTVFNQTLEQCRMVYNRVLALRKKRMGKGTETRRVLWNQENVTGMETGIPLIEECSFAGIAGRGDQSW